MKWRNLKFNRCPECDKYLKFDKGIYCACGFKTTAEKMKRRIEDDSNWDYDKTSTQVLCSQCGKEFNGQAWMMETRRDIYCPDCFKLSNYDFF
jgi:DNA-directed RNA polymerase subunit RPC12/RpoP